MCRCKRTWLWLAAGVAALAASSAQAQQISFAETDTAGTSSVGCSGLSAATVQVDLQMVQGGGAGSASHAVTVAKNSTQAGITFITPANSPGSLFWPGGQTSGNEWQVNLDVTTASSSYNWVGTYVCADAGGTFTTIGSHTGFSTSLASTGVKTDTITVASGTAEASTTQVFIVLGIQDTKANDGTPSFSFTADRNVLSPLVSSPTFVQGNSCIVASGTSCSAPSMIMTGGNTIIACADNKVLSATMSVGDSNGNVYKTASTNTIGTPTTNNSECWYAQNIASGSSTVTATSSVGSQLEIAAGEWSYVAPSSSALDCAAEPGGNGSGAAIDSGPCNATATHLPELAVGYATASGTGVAAGSGWTMRITVTNGVGFLEDRVISSAGNFDATMTQTASNWLATAFSISQYGAAPSTCPKGMLGLMGEGCG